MTEYVTEARYDAASLSIAPVFKEEIIRCRDCKYRYECSPEISLCERPTGSRAKRRDLPRVEPDGFCKWGKPRARDK